MLPPWIFLLSSPHEQPFIKRYLNVIFWLDKTDCKPESNLGKTHAKFNLHSSVLEFEGVTKFVSDGRVFSEGEKG